MILRKKSSIETCYHAASGLLSRYLDAFVEFEPGGQLKTERWFLSSITWHDFLLACMALCLTICADSEPSAEPVVNLSMSLELLSKANAMCERYSAISKDTHKVRQLIDATSPKFGNWNNGSVFVAQDTMLNSHNTLSDADWPPSPQGDGNWSI